MIHLKNLKKVTMYRVYTIIAFLCISFSLIASEIHFSANATLYDHMVSINKEWKTQDHQLDLLLDMQTSFETDDDRIQMHLMLVETVLRNRATNLSVTIKNNRIENLESLISYWKEGQFPINTNHKHRQPYFIDQYGTACAVGHLLQTDGEEALAQRISLEQNYAYIRELQYPELGNWAKENGFETAELAWIQPGYGGRFEECPQFTGDLLNLNPNNTVNVMKTIEIQGNRLMYIGGDFQVNMIGGSTVNSIIAYNGSGFVDLGIDITGEVKDIVEYNGKVIIVGDFQDQLSNATNIIEYTPGAGYTGLQSGTMNGSIKTAQVYECVLFVGGDFTAIDGNNHAYLSAYTPSNGWTTSNINSCGAVFSTPITVNGQVNDLTVANDDLIVGGNFSAHGAIANSAPGGLSFYDVTGWTSPTLNPGIPLTSVDHLEPVGLNYDGLLIGGDNLIGYDFDFNYFVQGNCLGEISIPANTGRIDALFKTSPNYGYFYQGDDYVFYRKGNELNTLKLHKFHYDAVTFKFDVGGEINAIEEFGYDDYYIGGRFSNLLMHQQSVSYYGSCYAYSGSFPTFDFTEDNGAIYKFRWINFAPVELANFDATLVNDRQVDLVWQTHTEENSSHFEIERSTSGEENSFTKVGEVAAAGNSIQVINYNHTDRVSVQTKYLYYRLKIVDEDGSFDYSEIKVVKLNQTVIPDIELFPNPANDKITLSLELAVTGTTQIQVFNLQGALVKDINHNVTDHSFRTRLDISDLAAGMYLLQVTNKSDQLVTKFQKF